ncbi:hypothetical protein O181_035147 [Austropuccinia psidii MF-1]|uniref:Uncharacterized protein n=1 Tax=Austropuccinia psidii MF-1 TaxID=1389203 RepID=A0A9Q3H8Q9_9BASI|nr:hypothetical protein [Austropuccinia psidii MF-1]
MRPKGGRPLAPKAQLGPPEPLLAPNPIKPKMAKKTLRTHFGQGPPWTTFQSLASGNHQRPPDQLSNPSPQLKGDFSHSSMHPVLKVAGMVHIWYYIPLCTIFFQKFNGDVFMTKFHDSKSRSQNTTPILKEDSSAHQSGNPWRLSEDYSRTPTTWPCRSWVGNYFRIIPSAILRVYSSFNQLSMKQVLQYSLENSIGPYRQQSIIPVCPWPKGANSYSIVGIQSHSFTLKVAKAVLAQFRQ